MFTGIVERTGVITAVRTSTDGRQLRVEAGEMASDCPRGSSVCVSGVCLTVSEIHGAELAFDVIHETLDRSTLGSRRAGDHVNLERSLRLSDRLDGHFVQGHVDGKATVDRVVSSSREHVLWLSPDPALGPYIVPKGSVAVDGVSLTIADVQPGTFSVALIPTTLERTTLSRLRTGDEVNIESDIITRTVVHRLSELSRAGGLGMDTLREAGFA